MSEQAHAQPSRYLSCHLTLPVPDTSWSAAHSPALHVVLFCSGYLVTCHFSIIQQNHKVRENNNQEQ